MESLRDLLIRHAHELADALETKDATRHDKPKRRRSPRGPVIVAPAPSNLTPEKQAYVDAYVRRALGR